MYRSFEDFEIGMVLPLAEYHVTAEEIIEFARKYDPQPQHINSEIAKKTAMKGLLASGWHTTAIFMRMQCDAFLLNSSSIVSPGTDEIRWLRPVRPGDTLHGTNEIIEKRVSRSKPDRGIITSSVILENQHNDQVMTLRTASIIGLKKV